MSILKNKFFEYSFLMGAGLLYSLAFSPIDFKIGIFISLVLYFYILINSTIKSSLFKSYLYGIAVFTSGVSWIFNSVYYYGGEYLIISILMIPLLSDGIFTFTESIVLITVFIVLMVLYKNFYYSNDSDIKKTIAHNHKSGFMITLATIFGFSLLLIGTEIFLASGISIAKYFGVTDYVIGLSITAVGTSIPELASSIESARKKNIDFIIGNILGSNIFNFTIVISAAGLISLAQEPLLKSDLIRDMIMILITLTCFYIIIKNYNYMSTKFLCISLLVLFVIYQISLYEINI